MPRRIGQDLFEVRLASELISRGLATQQQIEEALRQQVVLGGHLATNLWELRLVDGKSLTEVSAELLGVPVADLKVINDSPTEVRRVFTREFVEQSRILPFRIIGSVLQVATSEPWDMLALGRAAHHGGYPVEPYFLAEVPLAALMDKLYEIPTSARFWLGVESNERRARGKSETEVAAEELAALSSAVAKPKTRLMSFVSAEVEKLKSTRERPRALARERLIVQPVPDAAAPKEEVLEPLTSLSEALPLLEAAKDRDEVGEVLLRFSLSRGARVALFVRRQNLWAGWLGAGTNVVPHKVKSLLVPHVNETVFGLVAQTGGHYLGPLTAHVAYAPLLMALGGGLPRSVAVLPVHTHGRLAFAVYIDGGPETYVSTDISDIVVLAQRVPAALERIVKARVSR